jgi:hypothetical protein
LRRRRPTPGAQRLEGPISIGAKAFGRWLACTPNEFGLQGPSAGGRPAPTGKGFCVGGGRRLARSAWEGRFQSAQKPSADGWPARRMNSASRGLRPAVGLRRPGGFFCVGGGRRLARSAWEGRFQSAQKPSADGWPARRMNSASRGLRPAVGLRRPGGFFCVGGGRRLARSALRGRFQSAQKPSAGGRPARRMNSASRGLRPAVGLRRPGGFFCVGGGRRLARSALRGRFQSAQKPSAGGWPARRMNSASRGLRPAVGLRRPGGFFCVGGGRRLARSAWEGRFQSAQKPSAGGWPARRMNSASRGLRPAVGLRRPGRGFASAEADAWRAAPWKADFNRRESLRPMVGLRAG